MSIVTSQEMFAKAYAGGYAIGAFNVNNMEIIQGITEAAKECNAPVILQVSSGARKYANRTYLVKLVEAAVIETGLPICLHLDHGDSFELCKACVDDGFSSVMIDASSKPFEENVALTRQVVEYAYAHGAVVEAELGTLAGIEDDVKVKAEDSSYTRPEDVQEFVERTGCDSLAIAIGTSHGAYKFKPGTKPKLRFDILEEVSERLPGFPIVLHGSSSVPQEYVQMINEFGGAMPGAIGVPEDQLRQAARLAVCKINIDSDLRLAMTGTIRKYLAEHPAEFDPRKYLGPARENIKQLVLLSVYGSVRTGGTPMNFQELLMRLSASCFAADRPDYDWKTLRLFPETGLDLVLIVRLAAALILCVIGALVHNTVVQYILLALSALAAGYDYLASAIACILDRQVFRPAVIVMMSPGRSAASASLVAWRRCNLEARDCARSRCEICARSLT